MRDVRAMTLIELLVTVFIFSIFSTAAYLALELGRRTGRVGGVEVELQQGARKAMIEMLKDFRETDPSTVRITSYTDPQNSEVHQAISFASARGDPAVTPSEGTCVDAVDNNACFHVDVTGNPRWRSLVVYAPYETSDGRKELRRYVNFNTAYGSGNHFPLTFTEITSTQISLKSSGSPAIYVTFNREGAGGLATRVLMENMATEDADNNDILDAVENDGSANVPFDNADGVLNRGADFSLNDRMLTISLFLRKREAPFSSATHSVVSTLKSRVEMRN